MPETKPKQPRDNSPEARRERARKRQESAASTLRAIATEERKQRTKRHAKLGADVDLAGLGAWHEDTLLGGLVTLKTLEQREDWPTREQSWREQGAAFRAERKAELDVKKARVSVVVEFPRAFDSDSDEDKEARKALRAAHLHLVKQLGVWVGDVDLDAAYDVVTRYGGVIERRDGAPDTATSGDAGEPDRVH